MAFAQSVEPISKGYTIKLLPTSFQHGSKGSERRYRCLARRCLSANVDFSSPDVRARPMVAAMFWLVVGDHPLRIEVGKHTDQFHPVVRCGVA
jgi:hypothetical protein